CSKLSIVTGFPACRLYQVFVSRYSAGGRGGVVGNVRINMVSGIPRLFELGLELVRRSAVEWIGATEVVPAHAHDLTFIVTIVARIPDRILGIHEDPEVDGHRVFFLLPRTPVIGPFVLRRIVAVLALPFKVVQGSGRVV